MANILVTGGASGLGLSITKFLAEKHKVYFTFCTSADNARGLEMEYPGIKGIQCDFTSDESTGKLCEAIPAFGIEVIINNAFMKGDENHFHKTNLEEFENGFRNNIRNFIVLNQTIINYFRKQRKGRIITVLTSAMYGVPPVGWSNYLAQKAYIKSLCKSWAVENARYGIVSNTVSPTFMETPFHREKDQREIELIIQNNPLGRLLTPSEVAHIIGFLTEASPFVNGIDIPMNSIEHVI